MTATPRPSASIHHPAALHRSGPRRAAAIGAIGLAIVAGSLTAGAGQAEAATTASVTQLRADVVKLVNADRARHGCRSVQVNSRLITAAQRHADDMARTRYFSHTSADGTSWSTRIRRAGYAKPAGENIAYGYSSASAVMKAWIASPGHRRNIRNCNFRTIGVGFTANGNYWVQDFGY